MRRALKGEVVVVTAPNEGLVVVAVEVSMREVEAVTRHRMAQRT